MSVQMTPADVPPKVTQRPIAQIARTFQLDPRIPALVPGFDAPFFQAGLASYSDGPMRLVARRHGCPFCVTEALLDQTLISGGKGRTREDPDLLAQRCGERADPAPSTPANLHDHPIAGQIIGSDPADMADAARLLLHMGYDVIDVNFACPVRKIRRRNRGGHLLSAPDEAIAILHAVRDAVPVRVPLSIKLRRAYDDSPAQVANFQRILDAAFDLACAWATVHCRTVQQKYDGPADWAVLADIVRRRPGRLIFGSGDVWSARDIFAMLELTGVKAVAVARGCIGNPWLFRQARALLAGHDPAPPTLHEQRLALLDHFDLSMRLWGERTASRMMRKFGIKFSSHHPDPHTVKAAFITCRTAADWRTVIDRHYA